MSLEGDDNPTSASEGRGATPWSPPAPWPAGPPPGSDRRRAKVWGVVLGVVVGTLALMAMAAAFITLPYVIISPGGATPVGPIVQIDGARTYRHAGSLLFLTVSVSSARPNLYRLAAAWLDDDTEILDEEEVLGPKSRRQSEILNRRLMDESQLTAKKVALERLGYTVPVSADGAQVVEVQADAAAKGKLRRDDVITTIDGQPVRFADELGPLVRRHEPGETVALSVTRDRRHREVPVTAGKNAQGQAFLGISVVTKNLEIDFPVDVTIDPGPVSGPSAGLAFTLTIIGRLTEGDITGGREIAVTGTIAPDGSVGEIGGVAQKAVTARRAGAALMIVPKREAREAREHAGSMRVVGVDTLDDALAALQKTGGAAIRPSEQLRPAA